MRKQIFGWALAFLLTGTMAAMLSVSACRDARTASAAVPPPRDPADVSDIEVELILNRIREGDLHALKGDLERARRAWDEAREMGEGLWPIHEGLADSFARVERYADAVREYEVAEALVSEHLAAVRTSIAFKRAGALAAVGRTREAVETYLSSRQPGRTERAIVALAERGKSGEVIPVLETFARVHDPRVYRILCEIHDRLDQPVDSAVALARYCIGATPWDAALNVQVVDRLRKLKHWDEAIEVCRAWAKSAPEALDAYRLMGDLHREAGREREALIAYTSIVDVRPGDAAAHRMLGELLRAMGRPDEAIAQFEAARRARPEDRDTYLVLDQLYRETGQPTEAESMLLEYGRKFGLTAEMKKRLLANCEARLAEMKEKGDAQGIVALRKRMAGLGIPEMGLFDLKATLTWDESCDVDLHVRQPDGEHVFYSHKRSNAGGQYYVDHQAGKGIETFTLAEAPPGTYRVSALLYSGLKATAKLVVILFEDTPREKRIEKTFHLQGVKNERFLEVAIPRPR